MNLVSFVSKQCKTSFVLFCKALNTALKCSHFLDKSILATVTRAQPIKGYVANVS